MNRWPFIVLCLFAASLLPPLAVGIPLPPQQPQPAGEVSALVPGATRNAQATRVKDGLNWQDLLQTDPTGRLRATLRDTSILSLGRDSHLRVVQHDAVSQQTSLEMNYGRMRGQVVKLTKPGSRFEVRTPTAVVGVIGTDFYLLVTPDKTIVIVFSGQVLVTPLRQVSAGSSSTGTTVPAGQMAEATSDSVSTPVPTPPETAQRAIEETTVPSGPSAAQRRFYRFEMGGNYSFAYFSTGSSPHRTANGGGMDFTVYIKKWFGITSDLHFYAVDPREVGAKVRLFTYTFGPRFTIPRFSRVTPFFQVLAGNGRLTAGNSYDLSPVENTLAMTFGGGFDVTVAPGFAVRPVQLDYFMTRFTSGGVHITQNNMRMTSGVVFRF